MMTKMELKSCCWSNKAALLLLMLTVVRFLSTAPPVSAPSARRDSAA
jgi:hypothetical protein